MRALEFITGHVIYNPAYTYKFQLKTTLTTFGMQLANANVKKNSWKCILNLTEKHVSPKKPTSIFYQSMQSAYVPKVEIGRLFTI